MNQLAILSIILCMVLSIFILLIYRHFFYTFKEHATVTATFPDGIVGHYKYGQTPIHNLKLLDSTKNPTDDESWDHHAALKIGQSLGKSMPNVSSFITEHPVIMDEKLYNILVEGKTPHVITDYVPRSNDSTTVVITEYKTIHDEIKKYIGKFTPVKVMYNKPLGSLEPHLIIGGVPQPDKKIFYIQQGPWGPNTYHLYDTKGNAETNVQQLVVSEAGGTFTYWVDAPDLEDWHIALFIIMFHQYSLIPDTTVGNTHKYSLFNALLAIKPAANADSETQSIDNLKRLIRGLHPAEAGHDGKQVWDGLWSTTTTTGKPTFKSTVILKEEIRKLIIAHFSNATASLTTDNVNNIAKCFKHSLCNHANNEITANIPVPLTDSSSDPLSLSCT